MSNSLPLIFGCGYIGKKIARLFQQQSVQSVCVVHSQASRDACESMGLQAFQVNLDDAQALKQLPEMDHDRIVYLVPPPPRGQQDTRMTQFITWLGQRQKQPQRIVLISTTGIYGDCHGEWIDETKPPEPQADRAYRRLDAETQLSNYCNEQNIQHIIFRVPGIYGADKLPIQRITSGEPIVRPEDSGYTNRIHAEDLAAFCVEAMMLDVEPGIYNACDGNPSTMNDYFMRVADAKGLPRPEEISLEQAQQQLSAGMLSYLAESKRISNKKLVNHFKTPFKYPDLTAGLKDIKKDTK